MLNIHTHSLLNGFPSMISIHPGINSAFEDKEILHELMLPRTDSASTSPYNWNSKSNESGSTSEPPALLPLSSLKQITKPWSNRSCLPTTWKQTPISYIHPSRSVDQSKAEQSKWNRGQKAEHETYFLHLNFALRFSHFLLFFRRDWFLAVICSASAVFCIDDPYRMTKEISSMWSHLRSNSLGYAQVV